MRTLGTRLWSWLAATLALVEALALAVLADAPERDLSALKFEPLELRTAGPSGEIRDIVQGPKGFIWFATREGVHRFDGYEIRTFAHEKGNPDSLVNNVVIAIHSDEQGRLWIGTEKGVSRFVPETESFRNYLLDPTDLNSNLTNHVNAIVRNSKDELYVSSESGYIYRFDEQGDRFERLNDGGLGIIKSMAIDDRDRLWIGADASLHRYNPETGEEVSFSEPFQPEDPSIDNFISSICYLGEESVWLATAVDGALRFNSLTGAVEKAPTIFNSESFVHLIEQDAAGNLWIGHSGGLTLHEASTGAIHRYHSKMQVGALPGSAIQSLLIDEQGNVWAGSAFHGLFVAPNNKRFHELERYAGRAGSDKEVVSSLLFDGDRNLWVGLNSTGIDLFPSDGDPVTELRHDPNDPRSLSLHTVFALHEDSFGEIWVGTYRGGLQRYLEDEGSFVHYRHDPSDPSSLLGNDVRGIAEDEAGNLWVLAHGRGISYFDRDSETFTPFSRDPQRPKDSLLDDWASCIHYLGDGRLLVGTAVGLSLLDSSTGRSRNFVSDPEDPQSLSSPVVNAIFEDSQERLWIGTADGINRFDVHAGTFRSWSVEEGLPNRVVSSIQEDDQGRLWIGTKHGLARFNPQTERIRAFDAQDGLSDNAFFDRAAAKDPGGRLYFGTMDGVTYFDPGAIAENRYVPEVWITDFRIFNRPLSIDPDGSGEDSLAKSIMETERINLSHESKVISIGFVALNFIQSAKNEYAYRLKGFDPDWTYVGTRREATYTNLNPGRYLFQVKASNNDGYWNEKPRELAIVIAPPFWGTLWFRGLSAGLVVALPAFAVFLRLRGIKIQKGRLEETVDKRTGDLRQANRELEQAYLQLESNQSQIQEQNRELMTHRENLESMVSQRTKELESAKQKAERSDRLKSAFLANMSHEIRTPMNAIIGLLDVLQIDDLSDEERERYTEVIKQSSSTLMTLIDDILDLSRIESGEATVQLQDCNCDEVCEELFALFKHVASTESEGRIQMRLLRNGREGMGGDRLSDLVAPGFDPVRLKQILTNLLSNAIKFTDEGSVCMGYETESVGEYTRIRFFVTDSGIGIPEDELSKIFDRFHKVEALDGRVYRGTGLGLTISQRLAAMMNGRIGCESEVGRGTRFTVEFERRLASGGDSAGKSATSSPPRASSDLGRGGDGFLQGLSLLVVEDEEPNYLVIEKYLHRSGARLCWARDGGEALERFDEGGFDLVLLDIKLPVADGFRVLQRIRQVDASIPVVVQSAFAMETDQSRADALGASAFLAKPFTKEQLVSHLEALLGQRRGPEPCRRVASRGRTGS